LGAAIAIASKHTRTFKSTDRRVVEAAVRFAASRLRATKVAKDFAGPLEMAVLEAVGNVVRHAAHRACEFTIEVMRNDDVAIVEVVDHGPGFDLRPVQMPDAYQECGRGLPLMQSLCDSVEYLPGEDGNRLVLTKKVAWRESG
jgi:anti-sigma regulatory factor (Ser/Thr protein kinase)